MRLKLKNDSGLVKYYIDAEGYPYLANGKVVWEVPQPDTSVSPAMPRCALVSKVKGTEVEYDSVETLRAFLQDHFRAAGWRNECFTEAEFLGTVEPYVTWFVETVNDMAGNVSQLFASISAARARGLDWMIAA